MNAPRPRHSRAQRGGFTLIELIGVLAIISIMASMIVPNALRSLERETIRAEAETTTRLGEQIKLYLRDTAALPPAATWNSDIATYSDLAAIDVLRNKRYNNRLLVYDTSVPPPYQRGLLLSSMRSGLSLPSSASVAAAFQTIWSTADELIPSTLGWAGWSSVDNSGQYLVVARLNFRPVYLEDLRIFSIALNNISGSTGSGGTPTTPTTASYRITYKNGTNTAAVNLAAGASISLNGLHTGDRVDLYATSGGGGTPNYSHVLSTSGRTLVFDGTQWTPN